MAKALLAVDLQEEYFGKDRKRERFGKFEDAKIEGFIKRVNKHIAIYKAIRRCVFQPVSETLYHGKGNYRI